MRLHVTIWSSCTDSHFKSKKDVEGTFWSSVLLIGHSLGRWNRASHHGGVQRTTIFGAKMFARCTCSRWDVLFCSRKLRPFVRKNVTLPMFEYKSILESFTPLCIFKKIYINGHCLGTVCIFLNPSISCQVGCSVELTQLVMIITGGTFLFFYFFFYKHDCIFLLMCNNVLKLIIVPSSMYHYKYKDENLDTQKLSFQDSHPCKWNDEKSGNYRLSRY